MNIIQIGCHVGKGGPKYENCIQKLKERGYSIQDLDWDTLAAKV